MNKIIMKTCSLLLVVMGISVGSEAAAQELDKMLPKAVFTDPPRDTEHPMGLEAVGIPMGGVLMNAVIYTASGVQPHPTAVIFHGLPGNEQNLDLAQSLRRAGYNVLTFHYRGSCAAAIKNQPLLVLVAKDDSADAQAIELMLALKNLHAPKVTTILMDTDHSFSDHRIALESAILNWLQRQGL